jgi:hypothetical protein
MERERERERHGERKCICILHMHAFGSSDNMPTSHEEELSMRLRALQTTRMPVFRKLGCRIFAKLFSGKNAR